MHLDQEYNQEYYCGNERWKEILEMKYSELKMILKRNGCYKQSEGTRHESWYSTDTGKIFQIDRHDSRDAKKGILKKILKDAGIK